MVRRLMQIRGGTALDPTPREEYLGRHCLDAMEMAQALVDVVLKAIRTKGEAEEFFDVVDTL